MSAPPTSKVEGPKQKTEAELAPPDGDAPPVSRRARIANVIGIELLAPIAMVLGALVPDFNARSCQNQQGGDGFAAMKIRAKGRRRP